MTVLFLLFLSEAATFALAPIRHGGGGKSSISGLGLRHIAARLCYYMSENGRRDRWLMEKLFSLALHTHRKLSTERPLME